MIRTQEEHLAHYGILRRSGRYPWGSGDTESIRNRDYLHTIKDLKKQGMSESEIARGFGITTTELRAAKTIALAQQKQEKILTAQRLKEKGWSNAAIGERMGGLNESSVRALLADGEKDKASALQSTANMLKDQVAKKQMVDVGSGVEAHLGVTRTRLDTAVAMLREEGHGLYNIKIQQIGTGKFTTMKVLAAPGLTLSHVQQNRKDIKQITDYSIDHGRNFLGMKPPISISSRRIRVNYKEDGGAQADGVIYARRGVKDLSIGDNNYAQVRVLVDGTHYMKGMVILRDDLPDGVDLIYNTNKSSTGRKKDAMKEISDDPENPFGTIVRQISDPKTGRLTSAMNRVGSPTKEGSGEEGQWDSWSRTLPSQMLSKQSPDLAKQQLTMTHERRLRELDEINSLTNPTVRKDLLLKFADQTDAAAVHLKAAAIPRQATKVLLPVPSMKTTEVYAPSMRNGERVALVRFPHGGPFEIPQLTVNNRNREARKLLGSSARDAVGVHHSVAERLSGADFDGDTVVVIPNTRGSVKSAPALEGLKGFDPQTYAIPKGSPIPRISSSQKQAEMGKISNLITDMSLHGANGEELARAVRHSMVVIDSENHNLDHRQSEKDHGIRGLKEKYQGGKKAGAQTIISRAGSPIYLPQRTERPARRGGPIDPVTGKKVYEPTGYMIPERKPRKDPVTGKKIYVKTGKMAPKQEKHKKLEVTENALDLVSNKNTLMERTYAEHSNRLKAMANTARKESVSIKHNPVSQSAKTVYKNEVVSLNSKIEIAERNKPLERQAQLLANVVVSQKQQANPHMEPEDVKKIKQQALNEARNRTGASKKKINLTQREWEAIQAGALSTNKLQKVLLNSDADTVKQLAMPKHTPKMSTAKRLRAQSMLDDGYTQAEVADHLGVGLTTLKLSINE